MSVSPSTMMCPTCPDQMLETLSTDTGSFQRCPNCSRLFIAQELVAAASPDRSQCLQALGEMNSLLLPADKWCPKCLQRLSDGRVRSRGVIFMLCSPCQALWTSLETLSQFEETLERSIRIQIDLATHAGASGAATATSSTRDVISRHEVVEDSGLGHFFRAFARVFDNWADRFNGRAPRRPSGVGTAVKPAKMKSPPSFPKPEEKPLIIGAEPVAPSPLPIKSRAETRQVPPAAQQSGRAPDAWRSEPLAQAPSIDVPQFVFPAEPLQEAKQELEPEVVPPLAAPPIPEPVSLPEPTPAPEPELAPAPEVVPAPEPMPAAVEAAPQREKAETPPTFVPAPAPEPAPKPVPKSAAPKPVVSQPSKPLDLPQPKPRPGLGQKLAAFFAPKPRLKPAPKPKPAPVIPSEPVSPLQPVKAQEPEKAPLKKEAGSVGKLFGAFKTAANPVPKKPVVKLIPSPATKPILTKPQAVKPPLPAKPLKVKAAGDGFFAKLFAPKKKPVPKLAVEDSPSGSETIVESNPVAAAAPQKKPAVAPKKLPATRKAAAAPKREKPPRPPTDALAVWPPWVISAGAVACSAFRDFGFEAGPAALWGVAGWSLGLMVRLSRQYPFEPFKETTLRDLSGPAASSSRRRIPVILKGQIVLLKNDVPKGEVVFQQESQTLLLNRPGTWDLIPRLFGLSNPRQLLCGEVTVKGWYRHGPTPSLEVHDVNGDMGLRKSMVKSIRWAGAISLLVLALLITYALE